MGASYWLGFSLYALVFTLGVQGRVLGPGRGLLDAGGIVDNQGPLSGGQLQAWGNNDYNQTDIPANLGFTAFVEVCAGEYHACARSAQGTVVCWGLDQGNRNANAQRLSNVTKIACGGNVTLAVVGDHRAVQLEDYFNLGCGPDIITEKSIEIVAVSTNGTFRIVLTADGNATTCNEEYPIVPPPYLYFRNDLAQKGFKDLSAGDDHVVALFRDNTTFCWSVRNRTEDCYGMPEMQNVTAISASKGFSAVVSNGAVYTWGPGLPQVPTAAQSGVGKIAAGGDSLIMAVKTEEVGPASLVVFGGDNSTATPSNLFSPPQAVAAGNGFCVIIDAGSV